jgi:altronate dehydratase
VNPALVISASDNVATALEALDAGATITAGDATITLVDAIPRGHKLALRLIRRGEPVVKYGSAIGAASRDIPAGAHVHTHNVASTRGRGDLGVRPIGQTSQSDLEVRPIGLTDQSDLPLRLAEPPDGDL